jgi:hypothetical protein
MRSFFALFFVITLTTGCAVSSITVLEKKDTPKPFSKILAIYVDGDIDFAVFDSLTYDICIRPSYMDTSSLTIRSNTENIIYSGLSAPRSAFLRSSDLFGPDLSSYKDFNAQIDSLGIDAILLIHVHHYTYTKHKIPSVVVPLTPTGTWTAGISGHFLTPNAAFGCYLIRPHEYLPVWRAEIDVKGKSYINGKHVLRTDMVDKLEKTLVVEGYITPHQKE